jgi:phenylpyruvate tautomerase PptA (4-oxalocrotonate tautomerase family)
MSYLQYAEPLLNWKFTSIFKEKSMPMVTVHFVKNSLDPSKKQALAEEMTNVLLEIEGGQDTPGGRSIAWVMFNEIDNNDWYIGGKSDSTYMSKAGKFLVVVTVPEGSMNKERKSMVHKAVNESILKVTGFSGADGVSRSIWVQVAEIPEGHWGTSGKTAGVMGIAMVAGLTPSSPHLDYTRAYLDAKDRLYDKMEYPKDAAGRAVVRY